MTVERSDPDPPEPEPSFAATLRYMILIFGPIVLLALAIGWLLTRR